MSAHRQAMLLIALAALVAEPVRADQTEPSLGPRVLHVPVSERVAQQGILTPVPIVLEVPPELVARRVLAHYKMWGSPEWTSLSLRRDGDRWAGAIPCLEVSTITGDILYYVRVYDAAGAVVAYSGTRHRPYRVTIRRERDESVAKRCPDPADCPLGLPGCPSAPVEKIPCREDRDCEGGATCSWEGYCEVTTRRYNWLSLTAEQGIGVVATAGACSAASQSSEGYACFRESDGAQYLGNPVATNEPLRAGLAPTRVLLGYDRLVSYNALLGVRVGYAWRGAGDQAPAAPDFVPWSAELAVRYLLSEDPLSRRALRPFVLASLGFAQFDVNVPVGVREDVTRPGAQGGNDLEQTLDVWKRAGDAYVGVGGGLRLPAGAATDVAAELDVLQVFPFGATIFALRLGIAQGL
jgi:hypothetical protein